MPIRLLSPARTCRLMLVAAVGALSGCAYAPGGSQTSRDEFTYVSTPDCPQTIKVIDWTTNTTIWTVDVPIGKELVMRFYDDHDPKNTTRPALMRWEILDIGSSQSDLHNAMPAPDAAHRRVDPYIRKTTAAVPAPEAAAPAK